jgi:retron-type reverse transcriptase
MEGRIPNANLLAGHSEAGPRAPPHRFGNLYELRNEAVLKECWRAIRKEAANGVDGGRAQDYEAPLDATIHTVVERLKRKQYRAKHGRRTYIPQGNGQLRPLGMPAVEDQLRQLAVTRRLTALDAQDLLRCS